jgi:hypothetical protein
MKIRKNISNIALWCHTVLAVFAAFAFVVLTLAFIGVSPEGLGMGLFLLISSFLIPGLLIGFVAIVFTLISPSGNLLPATLLLVLVGVTTEFENASILSSFLILIYIATVAWAWKTRPRLSKKSE